MLKVKTILAGAGGLGLGCVLWVTLFAPGAQSQTSPQVSLVQSTWYWQGEASGPGGLTLPQTVPDPTVPSGDLAVGGPEQQGHAPAETYLEFDVSSIPAGSTITSFKISLPVDSSAQSLVPAGTVPPIIACSPQQPWPAAPGPQPSAQKPTDHCDTGAPKVTSSDGGKTYTVDIASIATGWVSGSGQNFGVAITDDPSNASTAYQVVFGPGSAISNLQATVDYAPPSSGLGAGSTGSETPAAGDFSSAPQSGVAAPSTPGSPVLPVTAAGGLAPATAPLAQPVPSTAPAARTPSGIRPVATQSAAASSIPPPGFWVVGALLAGLIGLCILELRRSPESELTRERGVGRLLSRIAAQEEVGP